MGDSHQGEVGAAGGSMSPFIPAGSRLRIERVPVGEIRRGDVVCFIGGGPIGVAHRVVRIERAAQAVVLYARGDAQRGEERVPGEAVIAVVRRVEHRLFAYDTDGAAGRAIARVALGEDLPARGVKAACVGAWRALCLARRIAGVLSGAAPRR